jgi:hypothetical protein
MSSFSNCRRHKLKCLARPLFQNRSIRPHASIWGGRRLAMSVTDVSDTLQVALRGCSFAMVDGRRARFEPGQAFASATAVER